MKGFDSVFLDVTEFYRVFIGFTGVYELSPGFKRLTVFYQISLGFTKIY